MRIVIALGGNALLKRGEPMTVETQRANVRRAATSLAALIGAGHQIVVTHGNGPQVGLLALQSAAGPKDGAYPLDILGAESEGMIGYLIEQELDNVLPAGAMLATLLTQIRVSPSDPAFLHPTKPIGPVYDEVTARRIEVERGWQIARDGEKWRRVVASPEPLEILEMKVISMLVERGVTVICAGGGGIPVVARNDGSLLGIEAVIDKDRASYLLARQVGADMLLLLTDVDAVYLDFGKPEARRIARTGALSLTGAQFASGSMGPKVEAATMFATETGRLAAIGRLEDAVAILRGEAGTTIEAGKSEIEIRR
ncbi:carbamate kinase [Mesorhizobium qingshengii]|uniref:Carbamate kinase n=1 Tax=Mesorhizobium qingshengii TaxID=1165689 RepID=A0ABT4R4A5_9HYPH|nr:carbamate kinase [Mesorhizobium qingshengii]MCZ8548660.1 carbamate kinase [Mesorhizobium qingshengii]